MLTHTLAYSSELVLVQDTVNVCTFFSSAVFHVIAEITLRDVSSVSGRCGMYQKAGQHIYPKASLDQRDDSKIEPLTGLEIGYMEHVSS